MKDFQDIPVASSFYGFFLIKNPHNFNIGTIKKLHNLSLNLDSIFSVERLFKGKETVLSLYMPRDFIQNFPELSFLEIEDYLDDTTSTSDNRKVNVNQSLTWQIQPKNNQKKDLLVGEVFFRSLVLKDDQKVFWQIVCQGIKKDHTTNFQATIRTMVADLDPIDRVELAKTVESEINQKTGLNKYLNKSSEQFLYESFKTRTLIPKELTPFLLTEGELFSLISLS